jgi:hypothetical protein
MDLERHEAVFTWMLQRLGTPRGLQGRLSAALAVLLVLIATLREPATRQRRPVLTWRAQRD